MSNLLAVLGGCGGIGRTVVQGARARGYDVAVLDLPASLAAHPPTDDTLSIALDATQDQQVADLLRLGLLVSVPALSLWLPRQLGWL